MKKILAILLALTMVLGLGVATFAADPEPAEETAPKGSITITGPKTDPNADNTYYDAYRIFDMTTDKHVDENNNYDHVAYTINSAWASFFAPAVAADPTAAPPVEAVAAGPGAEYLVDTNNAGRTLNAIAVNGETKYINITEDNVATFAKTAFEWAQARNLAPTKTVTVAKGATTVKFEDLDLGYYMVYPRGASVQIPDYTSIVSLTNTDPDGEIAQKAEYPTVVKEASDVSVEVGQTVTYTLTSNIPDTTGYTKYEFTFADQTSAGLDFNGVDSITVKIGSQTLVKGTDYTVDTTNPDFSLTINLLKDGTGDDVGKKVAKYTYNAEVVITYTATVNSSAVSKVEENKATLTYHNNPKDTNSTDTTPDQVTKVFSAKIKIDKVDGATKTGSGETTTYGTHLKDAKFVLRCKTPGEASVDTYTPDETGTWYKLTATGEYTETAPTEETQSNYESREGVAIKYKKTTTTTGETITAQAGKYYKFTAADATATPPTAAKTEWVDSQDDATVVTTDDNGLAYFNGLENGVYELIEIEAPDGYNLLTDPVEVTINGNDDADLTELTVESVIENNSGSTLPSTGGIGTTIFYVLGGLLAVGAGVVLVTKKRMGKEDL